MSKMIQIAIKERKVTILLSFFILMFGFYAYYFVPKQENPDTTGPAAQVIYTFPGASAKDVEELVTKPVEDAIAKLDGIDYIESYSYDNVSIVVVMLTYNVDYKEQWSKLSTELDHLKNDLPDGINDPTINTELTKTAGIILALTGKDYNYDQLASFAKLYKESLIKVDGIKEVDIDGELDKEIIIEIDNDKLGGIALSNSDVFDLIRAQNVIIPSGAIQTEQGKINVKVPKSFESLSDLKEMIIYISEKDGSIVRLGDVARVYFQYNENSVRYRYNQEEAVLITVYFQKDQNIILIGDEVRKVIDQENKKLPEQLNINEVLFLPKDVDVSVNNFINNLIQGIILVVIIVLFGMGARNAVIVSMTIPLCIATTFISMSLLGIDVQQVSIAALIIALGILVDNSIVISDAIQVKINEGVDPVTASYLGTKEQSIPVLSSTITTIAAFAPLMALPGEAGEFAKSLPEVVIIALSASFIVAMTVTPALASKFFKPKLTSKDHLSGITNLYRKLVRTNIEYPVRSILVVFSILLMSLGLFKIIDVKMFPFVDKNVIYFNIQSEIPGDSEYTEKLIKQAETILLDEPEILNITSSIGGGIPRFYITAGLVPPSSDKGQLFCEFDSSKGGRFRSREELGQYLQEKMDRIFVGGDCTVNLLEINIPGPTIDIKISGVYLDDINAVADQIYNELAKYPGTMNVKNNQPNYKYQYIVEVDDEKASSFGLSKFDIQYQINLALNGSKASVLKSEGKEYDLVLKSNIDQIDDIENLLVKSSYTNSKILVKQFAKVKIKEELTSINRHDRESLVSVTAKVKAGFGSGAIQNDIQNFIENEVDTSSVKISYGGDKETISKYLSGLAVAAGFALVIVYIILLIQFNSLKQPFIILATIPLSTIGILFSLVLTRTNFTFTVGLGGASLIGIVVNNAILLIEYINRARGEGMTVKEACFDSVEKRMRPILLSSVTTIFGLMPLVFANSSFFTPMAIALVGGLLISTILTLTVIPTIYYLLER
ncbi:efflux RND transporter permease subunit [Fusibacter ferrireducens]|uniref:Efflux RND transporter permease subunit n=1 Tax=Fusibacter ferrireducens TaxID=2785058 RepID=A0ABR9ZR74_9FIRM|nr:efflux RND transporter permease subunit [Fusibacter ferrireducens]MBF4692841.1 efflux RND transporter permease subunit [Fusibacter ferrireducens]